MSGQSVMTDVEVGLASALTVATMGASAPLVGLALAGGAGAAAIMQNNISAPSPNLQSPNALSTTPTQAQTNTTALQTQLAKEQQTAPSSSYMGLTGNLLDSPTTNSRSLVGN